MKSAGKLREESPKPRYRGMYHRRIKDAPMNRDVPQACVLSPEKCIVVVIGIIPSVWEKADGFIWAEGSSPECAMASMQDTTGV